MPTFIKTEKFKKNTISLTKSEKEKFISMHKDWVKSINKSGSYICSGYLVNKNKRPGGGGLLIFEAKDYLTAKKLISEDPMIKNKLVTWDLQEWIPISGTQPSLFNHLG